MWHKSGPSASPKRAGFRQKEKKMADVQDKVGPDGAQPKPSGGGKDVVTILVDNTPHKVHSGAWIVRDLKAAVGVDAALVLAEITPKGIEDLDDGATIEVRNGQRFLSHVRKGGSS